jgi:hypothetical protein
MEGEVARQRKKCGKELLLKPRVTKMTPLFGFVVCSSKKLIVNGKEQGII